MNIFHIGKYFPPFFGGIENVTADLVSEQSKAGSQVFALVHRHEVSEKYAEESLSGARVCRVPIVAKAVFVPVAPKFGFFLNNILDGSRPDVMHLHMPNVSCFWALFSKKAKVVPWVVHWHADVLGTVPDWRVKLLYPFYRIFERALLKKAAAVIVTSPAYLETSSPLSEFREKCHVVPLGIKDEIGEHGPIESYSEITTSGCDALKLITIGRLTYYKGHSILFEAISKQQDFDVDVHLTVIGSGELEEQLKSQVHELRLENLVTFAGSVDDDELKQQLNACDLMCLPSIERTEAFGVVLLEAMRASKPCLVTDVPGSGMSWVVQDGLTGLVVKAGDVDDLAEKIIYVANNRERLVEMGKAGRKRFEQHFTIEEVAVQIDEIYKKVLKVD